MTENCMNISETLDLKHPVYRECHNCNEAIHRNRVVFVDEQGRYWCDEKCIYEYEERLADEHEERRFQEHRDGGY